MPPRRIRRWLTLAAALGLAYVAALVIISLDPYWEDNGVLEFIPWEERWRWAAVMTPVLLLPIGLALYLLNPLIKRIRRRS